MSLRFVWRDAYASDPFGFLDEPGKVNSVANFRCREKTSLLVDADLGRMSGAGLRQSGLRASLTRFKEKPSSPERFAE